MTTISIRHRSDDIIDALHRLCEDGEVDVAEELYESYKCIIEDYEPVFVEFD